MDKKSVGNFNKKLNEDDYLSEHSSKLKKIYIMYIDSIFISLLRKYIQFLL